MTFPHQLIALLVTFIWGTNFVLIKIGLDDFPPYLFVFLRFLLAAFPLILFLPKPKVPWWMIASYGVFIGFGQFGLLFWAMQENITPGLASLVVQAQVFFTILLAAVWFHEQINVKQIWALAFCAAGLLLIAFQTDGQTTLLGLGIVLIAAASWAGGNLVVKRAGKVDIIAFLAWSAIFALPPLLAMSLYFEGAALMLSSVHNASLGAWSILLWQTVGNTMIGYGLWNVLLLKYPANSVTPWALMVPVFGIAASSVFLQEPLPWWKLLASGLILLGLVLNVRAVHQRSI
ncbi:MAG: EamA family transporter [Arenicellales bacterium]